MSKEDKNLEWNVSFQTQELYQKQQLHKYCIAGNLRVANFLRNDSSQRFSEKKFADCLVHDRPHPHCEISRRKILQFVRFYEIRKNLATRKFPDIRYFSAVRHRVWQSVLFDPQCVYTHVVTIACGVPHMAITWSWRCRCEYMLIKVWIPDGYNCSVNATNLNQCGSIWIECTFSQTGFKPVWIQFTVCEHALKHTSLLYLLLQLLKMEPQRTVDQ